MSQPLTLIFIGRTGCGKSTQMQKLKQKAEFNVISTGDLLRELAKKPTFAAKKIKNTLETGGLPPEWIATYLWINELLKSNEKENIIFDGSPRRLMEAKRMTSILSWLGRDDFKVFLIDISEDEAITRLKNRGRSDDDLSDIKNKFVWYKKNVEKAVKYFKTNNRLIRINGEQEPETVHQEIMSHLDLK